jgi:hypothetical protein
VSCFGWVYCVISLSVQSVWTINTVGECTAIHLSVQPVGTLTLYWVYCDTFECTSCGTINRPPFSFCNYVTTYHSLSHSKGTVFPRCGNRYHDRYYWPAQFIEPPSRILTFAGSRPAVTDCRCTTVMGVYFIKTYDANDWSLKRVQKYEHRIYNIVRRHTFCTPPSDTPAHHTTAHLLHTTLRHTQHSIT